MEKLNKKQMHWLENALQDWQRAQLLDGQQAAAIRGRYALAAAPSSAPLFFLLGTLLLLLALGQFLAHNWNFIAPGWRLLLALLILLSGALNLHRLYGRWPAVAAALYGGSLMLSLVIMTHVFQLQHSLQGFFQIVWLAALPAWLLHRDRIFSTMMQLLALLLAGCTLGERTEWLSLLSLALAWLLPLAWRSWLPFSWPLLYAFLLLSLEQLLPFHYFSDGWAPILLLPFALLYPLGKRFKLGDATVFWGWLAQLTAMLYAHLLHWQAPWPHFSAGLLAAAALFAFGRDLPRLLFALTLPLILLAPSSDWMPFKAYWLLMLTVAMLVQWSRRQRSFALFHGGLLLAFILYWMEQHPLLQNALSFALAGGALFALSRLGMFRESKHE